MNTPEKSPSHPRPAAQRASRPRAALMMLMCGLAGAGSIGAANAAPSDEVLTRVVQYDPHWLDTEQGTRAIYARIRNAAVSVCPSDSSSGRFISEAVQQCRAQAVARAVHDINSPRLAALHAGGSRG